MEDLPFISQGFHWSVKNRARQLVIYLFRMSLLIDRCPSVFQCGWWHRNLISFTWSTATSRAYFNFSSYVCCLWWNRGRKHVMVISNSSSSLVATNSNLLCLSKQMKEEITEGRLIWLMTETWWALKWHHRNKWLEIDRLITDKKVSKLSMLEFNLLQIKINNGCAFHFLKDKNHSDEFLLSAWMLMS